MKKVKLMEVCRSFVFALVLLGCTNKSNNKKGNKNDKIENTEKEERIDRRNNKKKRKRGGIDNRHNKEHVQQFGEFRESKKGNTITNNPSRLRLAKGVNLWGHCKTCGAETSCHQGDKDGGRLSDSEDRKNGIPIGDLLDRSDCHVCGSTMKSKDITRIIFYGCNFQLFGYLFDFNNKKNGGRGKKVNKKWYVKSGECVQFLKGGFVAYETLLIRVEKKD